jgi:ADP-heptose:LPS heptosyltransferase
MTPETIRIIDRWAGWLLCACLTLWRRSLGFLFPEAPRSGPVTSVLFVKLIEQGATVLAADAIARAAEKAGRNNLYFCVFEENRPILDILDLLPPENIYTLRRGNFLQFIGDTLRFLSVIRRKRIDAAVDMEFFARASAILIYLTGARRRVGLHRFTGELPYRGDLMTHRVSYNPYLHAAVAYRQLVDALEEDPGELPMSKSVPSPLPDPPRFVPAADEKRTIRDLLGGSPETDGEGPIVLLNPNASDMLPLRKWPLERFVELGRNILKKYPQARIVVTGAPAEAGPAERLRAEIGSERVISLAGRTSMRGLITLYTLADLLVTNDSGPAHFASLTDIDTVVLYGPETPRLFGPLGGRARIVYAKLACSPCVSVFNHRFSPCRNNRCMQAISVEQTCIAVEECLERRHGR